MADTYKRSLQVPTFVFLVALATIVTAWWFQIFRDLVPCPLCLMQRIPYYAGLVALLLGLLFYMSNPVSSMGRFLVGLTAVIFFVSAGLGAYHAGVEWHYWPGPSTCAAGNEIIGDANSLAAQMNNTKVVPCDEAAWRLFGFSMAGYNAIISFCMALILSLWVSDNKNP